MKKSILIFGALCASVVAFGQLKVQSNGGVVINPTSTPPLTVSPYQFRVNTTFRTGISVNTQPVGNAQGAITGVSSSVSGSPILYIAELGGGEVYTAGVSGNSILTGGSANAISFGVIGKGGGSAQGRNIGVFGYLRKGAYSGITNGAGVFGAVDFNACAINFSQPYAGYFAGDVIITNQLNSVGVAFVSDAQHLQDVTDLNQKDVINMFRLTPVRYSLKQRYTEYTDSTGKPVQMKVFDEESQLFQNRHYGLIAQEVQELYPDLVYENGDGYLSIDYIGIIPLLIASVKELRAEVDELTGKGAPQNAPRNHHSENIEAELFQNVPNPFNESTEIAFYLPQSVTTAMLCVYDMNGRQLSQNIITQRGNASFVVNGSQYGAGMYLYSLIADNKIVDTKRMILTK